MAPEKRPDGMKPGYNIRRTAHRLANQVRIQIAGSPIARRATGAAMKSLGAGIGYATLVEPRWIETTQLEIAVQGLSPRLDGYRIVHLTDIHHNMVTGRKFLERVVEKCNALDPDLVALTGDFVTHDGARLSTCLGTMGKLQAADGLLASRGNHDYQLSLEAFRDECEKNKITLLENSHVCFHPARVRSCQRGRFEDCEPPKLSFGGVGDIWMGVANPGLAFAGSPDGVPRLLLSHNPQAGEIIGEHHDISLVLSGHTHGGQVRPFNKPVRWLSDGSIKYCSGLVEAPHTRVFVSRGVGTSALYVRWNCRPEIALIVLRAA